MEPGGHGRNRRRDVIADAEVFQEVPADPKCRAAHVSPAGPIQQTSHAASFIGGGARVSVTGKLQRPGRQFLDLLVGGAAVVCLR